MVHQLHESLNMVCPTCKGPVDPNPDGCIAIYKGPMRGCPNGCDAFCWLCREICGEDAHPHCGRVHGDFFPPQRVIAQWERRYRWRRVQEVLLHAFPVVGAERKAALEQIRLNLQSHGLWPFPASEPAVGSQDEAKHTTSHAASFDAARRGDAGAVQAILVVEPAFVEAVDGRSMTMLMIAAHGGHNEVVAVLLEGGARVEQQDRRGRTALHMAVEMRHAEISRVLLAVWPVGEKLDLLDGMHPDIETAEQLAKIARARHISLCGISPNQAIVDFSGRRLGAAGTLFVAASLETMASLTSINLGFNSLGSEGAKALAPAIRDSPSITSVGKDGLNLKNNSLGAEGWGAILTAVCSSAVSKIASIDASGEDIGSKGAKLIGQALRNSVNPSLTYLW